jgi:hypothetical protein
VSTPQPSRELQLPSVDLYGRLLKLEARLQTLPPELVYTRRAEQRRFDRIVTELRGRREHRVAARELRRRGRIAR